MNDIAIRVENLSKQYKIGVTQQRYDSLRERLSNAAVAPFRRLRSAIHGERSSRNGQGDTIWALKDVSFDVKRGEVLGIIGRNGAGKSTLLKILSRITKPTTGQAIISGRVASLLEVGTGFHPELTGRENIYLSGAVLGMSRAEIVRKFDEIVAFSGVEKFLDTPVKRYSSGMKVRLAFSVAAHLEPEILLVDEVLAVGDLAFQRKCLGKMDDVAKEGRTVVFVSHNMAPIRQLCHTGLLLDDGTVLLKGSVLACINKYLEETGGQSGSILSHLSGRNPAVEIQSLTVNGSPRDRLELSGAPRLLNIDISGQLSRPLQMEMEVRIHDLYGTPLAFFSPGHEKGYADTYPAGYFHLTHCMAIPRMMRGVYYLSLYLTNPGVTGWVSIPRGVQLFAEGTPSATGMTFDYNEGRGWILLSSITDSQSTS